MCVVYVCVWARPSEPANMRHMLAKSPVVQRLNALRIVQAALHCRHHLSMSARTHIANTQLTHNTLYLLPLPLSPPPLLTQLPALLCFHAVACLQRVIPQRQRELFRFSQLVVLFTANTLSCICYCHLPACSFSSLTPVLLQPTCVYLSTLKINTTLQNMKGHFGHRKK